MSERKKERNEEAIGLTGSVFKFVVTRGVEHEDEIDEASGQDNHHCHLIGACNTPNINK